MVRQIERSVPAWAEMPRLADKVRVLVREMISFLIATAAFGCFVQVLLLLLLLLLLILPPLLLCA